MVFEFVLSNFSSLRVSKVCFVGDSGVGKTSIVNRYVMVSMRNLLWSIAFSDSATTPMIETTKQRSVSILSRRGLPS